MHVPLPAVQPRTLRRTQASSEQPRLPRGGRRWGCGAQGATGSPSPMRPPCRADGHAPAQPQTEERERGAALSPRSPALCFIRKMPVVVAGARPSSQIHSILKERRERGHLRHAMMFCSFFRKRNRGMFLCPRNGSPQESGLSGNCTPVAQLRPHACFFPRPPSPPPPPPPF